MSEPTGGTRIAITSLAQIEDKLRRALNLAGDVGLRFTPDAIPVVLAGDASSPGCSTYRGRRFAGGLVPAASGAAAAFGIKALDAIVLTKIDVYTGTAGINLTVRLASTDVAEPFAMATPFAPFSERCGTATDFAPIARSAFWAASAVSGNIVRASGSIVGTTAMLLEPIMLTANQFVLVTVSGAVTAGVSVAGYIF